jgi:Domain of unknown function (DU1801)
MTKVERVLAAIADPERRDQARQLDALFRATTGWQPRLWAAKMIGYGQYHYRYDSGRQGDFLACGFSPLARKFSIHILPGYSDFDQITARLGKFKRGKSCWYVNTLADIDLDVLADLIRAGLDDLATHWPVQAT